MGFRGALFSNKPTEVPEPEVPRSLRRAANYLDVHAGRLGANPRHVPGPLWQADLCKILASRSGSKSIQTKIVWIQKNKIPVRVYIELYRYSLVKTHRKCIKNARNAHRTWDQSLTLSSIKFNNREARPAPRLTSDSLENRWMHLRLFFPGNLYTRNHSFTQQT
jgi:hypothetical protein